MADRPTLYQRQVRRRLRRSRQPSDDVIRDWRVPTYSDTTDDHHGQEKP